MKYISIATVVLFAVSCSNKETETADSVVEDKLPPLSRI